MDKAPKYSVIIPVYNAEKTLERCVNSLLCQQYNDAEIILVNDGSTDGSGWMCEKIAETNRRVTYVNKPNGGVSSARNTGLEVACGKYIVFVDSDDAVEHDYFKQLDMVDSKEEYDFVWFSYKKTGNGKVTECILTPCAAETAAACALLFSSALCNKDINSPWNKRFNSRIVKNGAIRFHEKLSIGEDKAFNLEYAMHCRNCKVSDRILYAVNTENQQSLSRKAREDIPVQFQLLDAEILHIIETAEIGDADREQYLRAVSYLKLRSVYSEAKRLHGSGANYRVRSAGIRRMCDSFCSSAPLLPRSMSSFLLMIPVRLRMTAVIDQMGRILAK